MTTARARNRQAYNAAKKPSKPPSLNGNNNSQMSGPSSLLSESGSSNWRALSNTQLLSLSETELSEMEMGMSPTEKAQLGQKLLLALNQTQPTPPLMMPSSLPPSPGMSQSPSFPHAQPTLFSGTHGVETETASHPGLTPSTDASSPSEPLDPDDFRAPLTGKYKKQANELEELLGMGAFLCAMTYQTGHNPAFLKDAETIAKYGENVADSWARLGRKYPWLFAAVDRFVGYTAAGLALQSTLNLVQELLGNHGIKIPSIRSFTARGRVDASRVSQPSAA